MAEVRGDKYERGLDVKEIAKRARGDIKEAVRKGELPKIETQVRIRRYAGGQSIDLYVTRVPEGFPVANPLRVFYDHVYPHDITPDHARALYAPEFAAVLKKLEGILEAYNRDNSDSQTDYFDVHFYGHVTDAGLLGKDRDRAEELLAVDAVEGFGRWLAGFREWKEAANDG